MSIISHKLNSLPKPGSVGTVTKLWPTGVRVVFDRKHLVYPEYGGRELRGLFFFDYDTNMKRSVARLEKQTPMAQVLDDAGWPEKSARHFATGDRVRFKDHSRLNLPKPGATGFVEDCQKYGVKVYFDEPFKGPMGKVHHRITFNYKSALFQILERHEPFAEPFAEPEVFRYDFRDGDRVRVRPYTKPRSSGGVPLFFISPKTGAEGAMQRNGDKLYFVLKPFSFEVSIENNPFTMHPSLLRLLERGPEPRVDLDLLCDDQATDRLREIGDLDGTMISGFEVRRQAFHERHCGKMLFDTGGKLVDDVCRCAIPEKPCANDYCKIPCRTGIVLDGVPTHFCTWTCLGVWTAKRQLEIGPNVELPPMRALTFI